MLHPSSRLRVIHFALVAESYTKLYAKCSGEGEIRTPGEVTSTMVFKTISLNRSDTSPTLRPPMPAIALSGGGSMGIKYSKFLDFCL